jgi:hypothetical protein
MRHGLEGNLVVLFLRHDTKGAIYWNKRDLVETWSTQAEGILKFDTGRRHLDGGGLLVLGRWYSRRRMLISSVVFLGILNGGISLFSSYELHHDCSHLMGGRSTYIL